MVAEVETLVVDDALILKKFERATVLENVAAPVPSILYISVPLVLCIKKGTSEALVPAFIYTPYA